MFRVSVCIFFASRKLAKRNKNLFEFLLATWRIYWGYRTGMWPHPSQNPFSFSKYKQVHENRYLHYVYLTRRANHFIIAIFLKKKSSRGFPGNLLRRFSHLEKKQNKILFKILLALFPQQRPFRSISKTTAKARQRRHRQTFFSTFWLLFLFFVSPAEDFECNQMRNGSFTEEENHLISSDSIFHQQRDRAVISITQKKEGGWRTSLNEPRFNDSFRLRWVSPRVLRIMHLNRISWVVIFVFCCSLLLAMSELVNCEKVKSFRCVKAAHEVTGAPKVDVQSPSSSSHDDNQPNGNDSKWIMN